MLTPVKPPLRPLIWVRGSKKSLDGVPEDVKDVFGAALLDVQYGDRPAGAKPFGEGLPREIWKIVEDSDGNTYRAVMKKSKSGIATPRMDKDRVRERFNAAKRHYDETYRKPGER